MCNSTEVPSTPNFGQPNYTQGWGRTPFSFGPTDQPGGLAPPATPAPPPATPMFMPPGYTSNWGGRQGVPGWGGPTAEGTYAPPAPTSSPTQPSSPPPPIYNFGQPNYTQGFGNQPNSLGPTDAPNSTAGQPMSFPMFPMPNYTQAWGRPQGYSFGPFDRR